MRSLVAAPLLDSEGCPGLIVLNSRIQVRRFSEEDMEDLVFLAAAAAMRIRNIALAEDAARPKVLEKELTLARQNQLALLPAELPAVPGFELHASNIPSRAVSGDLYQVVMRREDRECVVLLADVAGKGMSASLLTASLEALASHRGGPSARRHLQPPVPPPVRAHHRRALRHRVRGRAAHRHRPLLLHPTRATTRGCCCAPRVGTRSWGRPGCPSVRCRSASTSARSACSRPGTSSSSTDGRFLAYVSDESGRPEVFIRSFPAPPGKWQISMGGGLSPVWRRDGKEIFYLRPDRTVVAVGITWSAGKPVPGAATPLFQNAGLKPPTASSWGVRPFEVAADGRFLGNVFIGEDEASPIVIQTGGVR